jgi:hypothetical protein
MDIGEWLRALGLSQYEVAFRENAIDVDVLRDLTDQHMKDLGVPLGHRLKMLALFGSSQELLTPGESMCHGNGRAERRQITVVCDLVGSTEMAARRIPRTYAR